jgi:hypothetical protein
MNGRRVHGGGDGYDAVEVVVLVEDHHDLEGSVDDADPLVQVFGLDYQLLQIEGELNRVTRIFLKNHPIYIG